MRVASTANAWRRSIIASKRLRKKSSVIVSSNSQVLNQNDIASGSSPTHKTIAAPCCVRPRSVSHVRLLWAVSGTHDGEWPHRGRSSAFWRRSIASHGCRCRRAVVPPCSDRPVSSLSGGAPRTAKAS
ncbi:hypothetical protein FPJ27_15200 [Burkholderia sp. MS455]|nr:hypothetical protein FPJ27_15200 [Burkholderia sp. MS455]